MMWSVGATGRNAPIPHLDSARTACSTRRPTKRKQGNPLQRLHYSQCYLAQSWESVERPAQAGLRQVCQARAHPRILLWGHAPVRWRGQTTLETVAPYL